MNHAGSRRKGKVAEREVAALVAEWWSELEPGCKFASTPSSGGWSTAPMRAAFKVAGDLSTTAERFPFTVEVKRREGWNKSLLLAGRQSPVWGWWAQASKSAAEEGRHPMLWIRKSREPWLVLVPSGIVKPDWGLQLVTWARFPMRDGREQVPAVKPCLVRWEELRAVAPAELAGPVKGERPSLRAVG